MDSIGTTGFPRLDALASEESYRAIVEAAVEAVISIDERGIVLALNPAAEKIFGFSREEVIGRNVNILMPAPFHEEHDGYIRRYLDTGEKKIIGIGREVEGRRKDGAAFPIQLAVSEVKIEGRRLFTGFIQDLTERKELERLQAEWRESLEEQVRRRTEELEQAVGDLERINHIISHDLRAPLRGIRTYVEILKEDLGDRLTDRSRKDFEGLVRASVELTQMIDELLQYSRGDRSTDECVPVDTAELTRRLATVLAPDAETSVTIEGDLPVIHASRDRIHQIFQNLIQNGLHYNRSAERLVELSARKLPTARPRWEFRFRDNGIGIDPRYHERIFGLFQRLHDSSEYSGTGVGLAAVRRAVVQLGGAIRLESALGEGSTFIIELPENASSPAPR